MWILAQYEMVGLFSLKASTATGSGAKSLLVPTPYALKMALLDAACRTLGAGRAEQLWPGFRDAGVAVDPPRQAIVTNLFAKVLKPRRSPAEEGSADVGPFGRTIAFREYVQHMGPLGVALQVDESQAAAVAGLLLQINYLGRRGGMVQLLDVPCCTDDLPEAYLIVGELQREFSYEGVLQVLDDCGPTLSFQRANIYSGERVSVGKERLLRHVVLPYRMVRSSKSFTLYERTGN